MRSTAPPFDDDGADPGDDDEEQQRRRRAAALLAMLQLGDWTGPVDEVAADLVPVYSDELRAVGLKAPGQTRNQARTNLGLPPLAEDDGGDEVPDLGDFDDRAESWASDHADDLVTGLKERTTGMLATTVIAALADGSLGREQTSGVGNAQKLFASVR